VKHVAHARFWYHYRRLPSEIQRAADKSFDLLKQDSRHPSLRFKRVGAYWSVRVSQSHRALAVETSRGLAWFWIGPHDEYQRLIGEA
jgi:uncharacterized protein (DUF427 family)